MAQTPKPPTSPLRNAFNVAERAVASRVEPLIQTGGFATAMSRYVAINRRVGRSLSKVTGGVLHLISIPTTTDVARLHEHLNAVDQQLSQLSRELEGGPANRKTTSPGRGPSQAPAEKPAGGPMSEEDAGA
jgi:hypothetical protein